MFTLQKLREMDTIEVVLNEELMDDFRSFGDGKTKHLELNFFLLNGVLKFDLGNTMVRYYYFNLTKKGDTASVYIEVYEEYSQYFMYFGSVQFDIDNYEKAKIQINKKLGKSFIFQAMKYLKHIAGQFLFHFYHLTEIIDNRQVEVRQYAPRSATNKPGAIVDKPRSNVVNLKSKKYEYVIRTKEELEVFKRTYNKHTEAWTVAGHTRKYKDGRTVYIKPYTKGQGKKNSKIYKA